MFLASSRIMAAISCGVVVAISVPLSVMRLITPSIARGLAEFRIEPRRPPRPGMPAGPTRPNQLAIRSRASPTSIRVGTSGVAGSRVSASTASARSFPPSILARAEV